MKAPARRRDATPTPMSIPFGVQVYTHLRPDGQTCRSAWAEHTCACGAYALTWEMKAIAWSGLGPRALDLTLIPDNQGVMAILAEAIEGPYRFAHDALRPYVTVGPSTRDQPITIRATPRLHLKGGARTRRLRGLQESMTFAVMLDHPDECLVEVDSPPRPTRRVPPAPRTVPIAPRPAPLPRSLAIAPVLPKTKPPRLVVAPEPSLPVDAPIPELLAAVCRAEDVHPELDDYVVIPTGSVSEAEPLPRWVVRSPLVEQIRIIKPRLKVDRALGEAHE